MRPTLPLLICALAGCGGDGDISGTQPDTLLTTFSGTPVTANASQRPLTWSANGEEIAFVMNNSTAVIRNMNDGGERVLFTAEGLHRIDAIESSYDAGEYFTTEFVGGALNEIILRRHTTGGAEVLTRRSVATFSTWADRAVVPSRVGDVAYVVSPDSLYVRRRGGASPAFVATGCSALAAFSPDGTEIICFGPPDLSGASRAVKFSLAGATPVTLNTNEDHRFQQAVWTSSGLYLLAARFYTSEGVVLFRPGQTNPERVTPQFGSQEMIIFFYGGGILSADARKFAYWTYHCGGNSVLFCSDERLQAVLYVKDLDTGSLKRIAVHNRSNVAAEGSIAIAPDGSRLVYIVGNTIFQVQL